MATDDIVRSASGKEKSIIKVLRDYTNTDAEAYYILFVHAPELLPNEDIKTYEDLQAHYVCLSDKSESAMKRLMHREGSQKATKYLLKRLDCSRDINLLNQYYKLAMKGDVQALKMYMEFKKEFFSDDDESDELKSILNGTTIPRNTDDDFEMEL